LDRTGDSRNRKSSEGRMGKAGYFLGVMGLIRGEKRFRIFHGMEKFPRGFPRYGKLFSTVWKIRIRTARG
jgi:hypothetical protein